MKTFQNYKKCQLKKGNIVSILTGDNKGAKCKILSFNRKNGYVLLEALSAEDKLKQLTHFKKQGGMTKTTKPVHISNVRLAE